MIQVLLRLVLLSRKTAARAYSPGRLFCRGSRLERRAACLSAKRAICAVGGDKERHAISQTRFEDIYALSREESVALVDRVQGRADDKRNDDVTS